MEPTPEGRSEATRETVPEGRSEATRETVPEGRSEATRETVPEGRSEATRENVPEGRSAATREGGDRILTIPNALSVLRLVLVPVFLYLLLGIHADALAVAVLMFSGFSDWADGKIARLVANQSSRLGALLDPAVDRIYMVAVPVAMAIDGIVPWWIVLTLVGRDVLLAATLPVLRGRGLTALPVTYVGKAATFALMSGLPLILLGQWDALWSRVILACGWAFLIWGMAMYLWSAVLYLIQVGLVVRDLPRRAGVGGRAPSG